MLQINIASRRSTFRGIFMAVLLILIHGKLRAGARDLNLGVALCPQSYVRAVGLRCGQKIKVCIAAVFDQWNIFSALRATKEQPPICRSTFGRRVSRWRLLRE
jgi:hypothetical protein